MRAPTRLAAIVTTALAFVTLAATPAEAVPIAKTYANCTQINAAYDGGIAKDGVKYNVVRSGGKTVKRELVGQVKFSTKLYQANRKSDRDGDGIACERS